MNEDSQTAPVARNAWFAAAFSLLAIGVGHVYCGRITQGLVLFGLSVLHLPLMATLAWGEPSRAAMLLLLVVPILLHGLIYFAAAIHAFWLASGNKNYQLRDYNRPLVYAALVFIGMTYPLLVAVTIRDNLFEAYFIPTNSMAPTIFRGERVLCNRARFRTQPIQRGDLVVFKPPGESPAMTYVKRVIALPGDSISVMDGKVVLNGEPLQYHATGDMLTKNQLNSLSSGAEPYEEIVAGHRHQIGLGPESVPQSSGPVEVPEGQLFVLGDLRPASKDSRFFGPIEQSQVLGRLEYRYWPSDWSRFGVAK